MPWQAGAPQAGFSSADRTWLKRDPAHAALAVDQQAESPQSTLSYTRQLLALRRHLGAVVAGDITLLDTPDEVLAFVRGGGEDAVLCAFNLGETVCEWTAPAEFAGALVLASENAVGTAGEPPMVLAPGTGYWAANGAETA
jgi:alpha-glucosidase